MKLNIGHFLLTNALIFFKKKPQPRIVAEFVRVRR